ncbi:MAG: hypothetical protein GWN84_22080 [Gammaproteobacteria bacterium]|nr:hypothetical protein [Gammaproteobacteria bacterium]NIR88857.1 hypothetical protein [Gammaproteobacteria bacterium]NIU06461.1 hypothetical protein [Gammaproteobacteria bacterium]NIV53353.1 hypothetical protein [Gammaproteobacteria bacterium]NIV74072.1 hypothetical protein [Gammaproteobacteria bacterium]
MLEEVVAPRRNIALFDDAATLARHDLDASTNSLAEDVDPELALPWRAVPIGLLNVWLFVE